MWKTSRRSLVCLLCCLALGVASAKYLYIHDETVWTKQSWQALKLRFPLEKLLQEKDLEGFEAISSKGAFSQETLQEGLLANKAQRTHPLLEDSIQEEAQLGVVAGLMGCKVCHHLVAAVWSNGRQEIHSGLGVPSTSKLNRQLWHICEKQVSGDLLRDWSILLMGSPLAAAAGNGEEAALAYVFKAREAAEAPSEFEQRALMRSCTDIHEGQESEDVHFATELAQKLGEYEKAWSALRAEHRLGPVRRAPVLEHQGTPDGETCKDYHNKCPWWADKGECPANWKYMVGDDDQKALKGYCRFSCGACSPSAASGLPEEAEARLEEASAALLAGLESQLCAQRQPCSGMSGDAHRAMDTAKKSGAVSPVVEPSADVIAHARNNVRAQMRLRDNPLTALDGPLDPGSEDEVLPGGVGAAALAEVASHCYYVSQGWWGYELCPGHHLGQFHATEGAPRIESALSLGRYDAEQDGKGGLGPSDGWPVLSTEDMLAGLHATVPYIITTYSGGASCDGSDAAPKRSAKVQLACSPDSDAYLLVREPETCKYVVTLYHPSVCAVEGYQLRKPMEALPLEAVQSAIKNLAAAGHEEL